jgi:hypothetical protein
VHLWIAPPSCFSSRRRQHYDPGYTQAECSFQLNFLRF